MCEYEKKVKERILVFSRDSEAVELNNHSLRGDYRGYRSINIAADWRAVYKEADIGGEVVGYFVAIGRHKDLYDS